ncbi:hypothetical protein P7C73_g4030, partial [Tremellales sp. Uapishka_1]
MSISLPNGTLLPIPSAHSQLSAAVTRILHLCNFSADLKTRDLQIIFKDWENDKGGFRIKWVDDVNALVVFADASVAKRAYLSLLLHPPSVFPPPAQIKPYDRPDAAAIIQSLQSRAMGHRSSMSTALSSGSISLAGNMNHPEAHQRTMSVGLSGFTMPSSNSLGKMQPKASGIGIGGGTGGGKIGGFSHARTGSASSSWGRQSLTGALNFGGPASNTNNRLPTHSESSSLGASRASSSSGSGEAVVILDASKTLGGSAGIKRRESVSADKALREVGKALGMGVGVGIEAQ